MVIPNLRVRDEDEELFEANPLEYIRRDAEGSDSDTRRRAAGDLVRSLVDKFPAQARCWLGGLGVVLGGFGGCAALTRLPIAWRTHASLPLYPPPL